MKVKLKCSGYLRDLFGQEREEVELPENATVQDLLHWIEEHHASAFPPRLPSAAGRSTMTSSSRPYTCKPSKTTSLASGNNVRCPMAVAENRQNLIPI